MRGDRGRWSHRNWYQAARRRAWRGSCIPHGKKPRRPRPARLARRLRPAHPLRRHRRHVPAGTPLVERGELDVGHPARPSSHSRTPAARRTSTWARSTGCPTTRSRSSRRRWAPRWACVSTRTRRSSPSPGRRSPGCTPAAKMRTRSWPRSTRAPGARWARR
jgi:hypothetical protein